MRVGEFEILPVVDGRIVVPASMFFPKATEEDWAAAQGVPQRRRDARDARGRVPRPGAGSLRARRSRDELRRAHAGVRRQAHGQPGRARPHRGRHHRRPVLASALRSHRMVERRRQTAVPERDLSLPCEGLGPLRDPGHLAGPDGGRARPPGDVALARARSPIASRRGTATAPSFPGSTSATRRDTHRGAPST